MMLQRYILCCGHYLRKANMENFVAVGNNELGETVKKGDILVRGHLKGALQYSVDETGKEYNMLGFIEVADGECYLATIKDKLVFGWEKYDGDAN